MNNTSTFGLSYPNVFHALYQAVNGNKKKLDLEVIQKLFKLSVEDSTTVAIKKLNEVELGLVFTLDNESDFLLDATDYEIKYGPTTAFLTLKEYERENYIDSDNSCKFKDLCIEKQKETEPFVRKGTFYVSVAVAAFAVISFVFLRHHQ